VFKVRPYTVRKGDTLDSIARKRDIKLTELVALNHDLAADTLVEGQTILLPGGKLSARDKEILAGIGTQPYRLYPVREGEKLADVITKRNISRAEMEALNPNVNLDRLTDGEILKLPAGKYTVREQEMMTGSGVPTEFFNTNTTLGKTVVGGIVFILAYSFWLWRQKQDDIDDDSE
jgi:LysM repeat protein